MEISYQGENHCTAKPRVMPQKYYYLDSEARRELDQALQMLHNFKESSAFWADLCEKLPVEKIQPESLRRRVEGLNYVAEQLWSEALQRGQEVFGQEFDRQRLQKSVRSLPISHYHYIMGSREPRDLLQTRRDGLHDPNVALSKLQQDIKALADFILQLPSSPSSQPARDLSKNN